jgi:hypothetical protein
MAPLPDEFLLPAGVRARVARIDGTAGEAILARMDTKVLAKFDRGALPGDAEFFRQTGLAPQIAIESAGRRYFLSRPFLYEGRPTVVAFQETAGGTFVPRTFYYSGEHAVWRVATAVAPDGFIYKGPTTPITQRNARGDVTGIEFVSDNKGVADIAAELQAPLGRWLSENDLLPLTGEQAERAFRGHVEEALFHQPQRELSQWVNTPDATVPLPNGALIPDGSRVLDQWTSESQLYGTVENFLMHAEDGSAIYLVVRDAEGQVWIPSIQDTDAGLTPFGTRWDAFDARNWTDAPMTKGDSAYVPNPAYENELNRRLAANLPPTGMRVAAPTPELLPRATNALPAAPDEARRFIPRTSSAVRGSLDALQLHREVMRRKEEVESALLERGVPTDPAVLDGLLALQVPAELARPDWSEVRNLAETLRGLQVKQAALEAPAAAESSNAATGAGQAAPSGAGSPPIAPGASAPEPPPESVIPYINMDSLLPFSAPTEPSEPGGAADTEEFTGNDLFIGSFIPTIPPISYELTPSSDSDDDDEETTGTDTRDSETALDLTAGNPAFFNPFGLGDALDTTVQNMTIELEFEGGSVTLPPGEGSQVALRRQRAQPRTRLADPMIAVRRTIFEGPSRMVAATRSGTPVFINTTLSTRTVLDPGSSALSSTVAPRPAEPAGEQQAAAVQIFLANVGNSTGEAFIAQIYNTGSSPITLAGGPLVVEPLKQEVQDRVRAQLAELGGLDPLQMNLDAYCLEFLKLPPLPGQIFQIAGQQLQERYAPVRDILARSRELFDAGRLTPDTAPQDYFHAIRQWAIWTDEQSFDQSSYTRAFIEHTRKSVESRGQAWDPDFDNVLRGAAGGRWNDIQTILSEAGLR